MLKRALCDIFGTAPVALDVDCGLQHHRQSQNTTFVNFQNTLQAADNGPTSLTLLSTWHYNHHLHLPQHQHRLGITSTIFCSTNKDGNSQGQRGGGGPLNIFTAAGAVVKFHIRVNDSFDFGMATLSSEPIAPLSHAERRSSRSSAIWRG